MQLVWSITILPSGLLVIALVGHFSAHFKMAHCRQKIGVLTAGFGKSCITRIADFFGLLTLKWDTLQTSSHILHPEHLADQATKALNITHQINDLKSKVR
jgi:hypothetical protein